MPLEKYAKNLKKFQSKNSSGKLSPNDVAKMTKALEKQTKNIDKLSKDIEKLEKYLRDAG
jgi:prefoldin subunit 5